MFPTLWIQELAVLVTLSYLIFHGKSLTIVIDQFQHTWGNFILEKCLVHLSSLQKTTSFLLYFENLFSKYKWQLKKTKQQQQTGLCKKRSTSQEYET